MTKINSHLLVVCGDKRFCRTFKEIEVDTFGSVKALLESDQMQKTMEHLDLFKVWTPEKQASIVEFLSKKSGYAFGLILDHLRDTLENHEITDPSLPVDNNEAFIDCLDDIRHC